MSTFLLLRVIVMEENFTLEGNLSHCPLFDDWTTSAVETFALWTDGAMKTVLASLGLLGNAAAAAVLMRPRMRTHCFNRLLLALSAFDSLYLLLSLIDAVRTRYVDASANEDMTDCSLDRFLPSHNVLNMAVPSFIYPVNHIALTASVYMTVAIAFERYVAVHFPLDYNVVSQDGYNTQVS